VSFLTRASLTNRLLVILITGAVGVFGVIAATMLRQELLPSLDVPATQVVVTAPGVSPDIVVEEIAIPVEAALSSVANVTDVTTTSSSGSMIASVQWDFGPDTDSMIREIESAVNDASVGFPAEARFEVLAMSFDDAPAVQLAASTDGDTNALVASIESVVVPELSKLPGVDDVQFEGAGEEQLTIVLRPTDVHARGLTSAVVSQAVQANSSTGSAGQSEFDGRSLSIEVGQAFASVEELQSMPIATPEGPIALADVADVTLEPATSAQTITRVDGEPAMFVTVVKSSEASLVDVSHKVAEAVRHIEGELGAGVSFSTVLDQGPYIEQSIHDLLVEGGLGLLFAVVVILVFLASFRSTIVAAVSIPLSILITLIGLLVGDFALNILTLGALTISIGRVVDDSIVVIENIRRRQGHEGLTAEGVLASVRQVAGPIIASTITTVAVFLPIAFVSGIAGQLFRPFAVTVSIALLASLLVSLTVVPVLAFRFLRRPDRERTAEAREADEHRHEAWAERIESRNNLAVDSDDDDPLLGDGGAGAEAERLSDRHDIPRRTNKLTIPTHPSASGESATRFDRLQRLFLPVLGGALRHPLATLGGGLALVLVSMIAAAGLNTDLLGGQSAQTVTVSQQFAAGTDLQTADERARQLETLIGDEPGVETYLTTVRGPLTNRGTSAVDVTVTVQHDAQPEKVASDLRTMFSSEKDITITTPSTGLATNIELNLRGENAESLATASQVVRERIAKSPSVLAVEDSLSEQQSVLHVEVDRQKAAQFGFTQAEVAQSISDSLQGTPVGSITLEGSSRNIVIRSIASGSSPEEIAALPLPISQIQQQQAVEKATAELTAEQEAMSAEAESKSQAQFDDQIDTLRDNRDEARSQLSDLQSQMSALVAAPVVPAPTPGTPEEQALADAQAERAEQISGLQSAIDQLEETAPAFDEQIAGLQDTRDEAAQQQAAAEDLVQRQADLQDLRATPITVGDVAVIDERPSPASIVRSDGVREVTLTVTPTDSGLGAATQAVEAAARIDLPQGVSYSLGGASTEQADSFAQLGGAMLFAIILVFIIVVATFRSVSQALVLLASVPLAATGAILALAITGTPLGLPALIGFLMLIGVVVTNAIVLIDLVNKLREEGLALSEAVLHGARIRLRPILMTAAATVFALIPMALGLTGGGGFISQPLAIVVIGGLVSSTLLTLIIVPVLYLLTESRRERRALQHEEAVTATADGN
jgi:multidrug efflux pump subunit AcrB